MTTETPVAPTATPEPAALAAPSIPEATTIAEHEAQLATLNTPDDGEDAAPVERTRHRARSQRATPDDVAQIAQLTKRLREAEDALNIERQPGESDRVYQLRRRAEVAELAKTKRELEAAKPEPVVAAPAAVVPPKPTPDPAPAAPSAFTEPEPKLEDFNNETDPYLALSRAWAKWDRRKEHFETQQEAAKQEQTTAAQQAEAAQRAHYERLVTAYKTRATDFAKQTPDFDAVLKQAEGRPVPPLLEQALLTADNGPQLVYTLAQQPLIHDEALLLTVGRPIDEYAVASTQRWLTQRLSAVTTGSATAPSPTAPVPRPLNPVRTGPMSPADEPPKDGHSLREHERFWSPKGRRR